MLVLAALAALWRFTPVSEVLTAARVTDWAQAVRGAPWAPFAAVAAYTPAAFVMFPRPLLTVINVVAFGPWLGFAYSMTGILLAAYVTYVAGRFLDPDRIRRLAGRHFDPVKDALRRHGFLAMLAVRIVPVAPFAVEGVVAGSVGVRAWHYGLGTFLGMLPGVLLETVFGDQVARALQDPSEASWWIAGAALALLAVIAVLARVCMKRRNAAAAASATLTRHGTAANVTCTKKGVPSPVNR